MPAEKSPSLTALLPRPEEQVNGEVTPATPTLRGGAERILVVEDEPAVRTTVRRMLERLGYKVLEAADGAEALGILDTAMMRIDLVLTDMVMPDVDGRLLAECVAEGNRAPRVLCMSGYPDDVLRRGPAHPGLPMLQKPFTQEELARAVRESLDDKPSSSS
jgi:CheY-like chemotaxis protein